MRILVTGARAYYALPVVRALGRAGHQVTVADCHPSAMGFYSRYVHDRWVYPSIARDPEAFLQACEDFLQCTPHDLILPLYEETLVLSKYANRLCSLARLPLTSYDKMLQLHDKRSLYQLAGQAQVPIPPTIVHLDQTPPAGPYPLMLKVPQSSSARGVAKIEHPRDFLPTWHRLARQHQLPPTVPALVQSFIAGDQYCTLSFAYKGQLKGTLIYRNLCEYPINGGAGIVRESVAHPLIEQYVAALVAQIGWHGVVGFDFLVDRQTDQPFLIDANPRLTPAIWLAQQSGLDLLSMLLAPEEPPAVQSVQLGQRTHMDPLVALWMLRALFPQPAYQSRLRQAFNLLKYNPYSSSDVLSWDDWHWTLALGAAARDLLKSALQGRQLGLDLIAESQFADYTNVVPPFV